MDFNLSWLLSPVYFNLTDFVLKKILSFPEFFIQKSRFSDAVHELKLEKTLVVVVTWKSGIFGLISFKIELKRKDRCLWEITEEHGSLRPGSRVFYKGG